MTSISSGLPFWCISSPPPKAKFHILESYVTRKVAQLIIVHQWIQLSLGCVEFGILKISFIGVCEHRYLVISFTQCTFHTPNYQRLGPFQYIVHDWGNLPQIMGSYRHLSVG
jgi:hypothetical protein